MQICNIYKVGLHFITVLHNAVVAEFLIDEVDMYKNIGIKSIQR